jgi:hypothetical protein
METVKKSFLPKITSLVFLFGLAALLLIPSPIVKNTNDSVLNTKATQEPIDEVKVNENKVEGSTKTEGGSSVSVNVDNSTSVNQNGNNFSSEGTCTLIKNGVTTTVPASQVKINEKNRSGGSIDVKVDCKNSVNSNSSNSTNNKVEIHTNTSN